MQISTPGHAKYGKHLKRDELKALIKPRDESTEAVLTWLENSGIPALDIEDDGEWINFYASVSKAESMLETRYHVYRNKEANVEKIRTLQYSVPQNVSEHITMIHPTTRFPSLRAHRSNVFDIHRRPATADAMVSTLSTSDILNVTACNTSITPACIRVSYNLTNLCKLDIDNISLYTALVTTRPTQIADLSSELPVTSTNTPNTPPSRHLRTHTPLTHPMPTLASF